MGPKWDGRVERSSGTAEWDGRVGRLDVMDPVLDVCVREPIIDHIIDLMQRSDGALPIFGLCNVSRMSRVSSVSRVSRVSRMSRVSTASRASRVSRVSRLG